MTERQKVQHKETSYNNFQGKTGRGEKESKKKKSLLFFFSNAAVLGSSRAAAEQRASTQHSRERSRKDFFNLSLAFSLGRRSFYP